MPRPSAEALLSGSKDWQGRAILARPLSSPLRNDAASGILRIPYETEAPERDGIPGEGLDGSATSWTELPVSLFR